MNVEERLEKKLLEASNKFDFLSLVEKEKNKVYYFDVGELSRLFDADYATIHAWVRKGKLNPVEKEDIPEFYKERTGRIFSSTEVARFMTNHYKWRRIAKANIMMAAAEKMTIFNLWSEKMLKE